MKVTVKVFLLSIMFVFGGCAGPAATPTAAPTAAPTQAPSVFHLGAGLGLTGNLASEENPALRALQLGLDQVNAAGGVDGKWMIDLIVKDMRSDPTVGAQVGQDLISAGAQFVLLPADQDPALAVAGPATRAGIPSMSIGAGSVSLPAAAGNLTFLTAMGNNQQSGALADYAYNTAGYRTAHLMTTNDFSFGLTTPLYFQKAFESLGGAVTSTDTWRLGTGDFSAQVTKIKNLSPAPDVIMISAFGSDPAAFVKQLRAAGVQIPVLCTDGADTPLTLEVGGAQAEGLVFISHAFAESSGPTRDFYNLYETRYGVPPENSFAYLGYDASQVIIAALHAANSTDPTALVNAINSLENVVGASGNITYLNRNRVPLKSVALIMVHNGQLELIRQYVPDPSVVPDPSSVEV